VRFHGVGVLVTGASGFIGSHLARVLTSQGAVVTAVCRSITGQARALTDLTGFLQVRQGNLEDASGLRQIVAEIQPEYVFHLGAVVDLERSRATADACMRVNVMGTLNLLQALEGVQVKRLVFTSTSEVYGDNPTPFHEDQRERPPSPYAVSKLAAEHLCLFFHRAFGCPISVLRLSTVYGPGQSLRRLIPSAIMACLRRERLALGAGEQSRDFVYVRDVVEGLLRAALREEAVGEIINLGHERGYEVREVLEMVTRLGGPCPEPLYGRIPRRVGEARMWASSAEKARRLLNWEITSDLETGLQETIAWCRRVLTVEQLHQRLVV